MPYKFPKSLLFFLVFLLVTAPAFGLGGDSDAEKQIPLPPVNYSVTLRDAEGFESIAKRVSWNGKVYIQGKRGASLTTIPFEKIKKITVNPKKKAPQDSIATTIELKKGGSIEMNMASNSKCYGETDFGKFEVFLRDVSTIEFE